MAGKVVALLTYYGMMNSHRATQKAPALDVLFLRKNSNGGSTKSVDLPWCGMSMFYASDELKAAKNRPFGVQIADQFGSSNYDPIVVQRTTAWRLKRSNGKTEHILAKVTNSNYKYGDNNDRRGNAKINSADVTGFSGTNIGYDRLALTTTVRPAPALGTPSFSPVWRDTRLASDYFEYFKGRYQGIFAGDSDLSKFWDAVKAGKSKFLGSGTTTVDGYDETYFKYDLTVKGNVEYDCWTGTAAEGGVGSIGTAGANESREQGAKALWIIDASRQKMANEEWATKEAGGATDGERFINSQSGINGAGKTPSEIIAKIVNKQYDELTKVSVEFAGVVRGMKQYGMISGDSETGAYAKLFSSKNCVVDVNSIADAGVDLSNDVSIRKAQSQKSSDGHYAWFPGPPRDPKDDTFIDTENNPALKAAWENLFSDNSYDDIQDAATGGSASKVDSFTKLEKILCNIIASIDWQIGYLIDQQEYFEKRGRMERAYIEAMIGTTEDNPSISYGEGPLYKELGEQSRAAAQSVESNAGAFQTDDKEKAEKALREAENAAEVAQTYSASKDATLSVKDNQDIPDADAAAKIAKARFQDQCYLLNRMGQLAAFNMNRLSNEPPGSAKSHGTDFQNRREATYGSYMSPYTLRGGRVAGNGGIYMVHGEPGQIMNRLTYNPLFSGPWDGETKNSYGFDGMTPAQLSKLLPMVRLYKVYPYSYAKGGSGGTAVELEIPFFNNIVSSALSANKVAKTTSGDGLTSITKAMFSDNGSRGVGAGIISFDWGFFGKNPYSSRRDISASMRLFFHDFNDILRDRIAINPNNKKNYEFRYIDLITMTKYEKIENPETAATPINFKIKAVVGWAFPDDASHYVAKGWFTPAEVEAVKNSYTSFYLTPTQHEWDIREDNTVELKIDYIGSIYGILSDSKADILMTSRRVKRRKEREDTLAEFRKACPDDEESYKELRKEQQEEDENDMTEAYAALFQWLQFGGVKQYANIYDSDGPQAIKNADGSETWDPTKMPTITHPTLLKLNVTVEDILKWKGLGPFGAGKDTAAGDYSVAARTDKDGMVSPGHQKGQGYGSVAPYAPTGTNTQMTYNITARLRSEDPDDDTNYYRTSAQGWYNNKGEWLQSQDAAWTDGGMRMKRLAVTAGADQGNAGDIHTNALVSIQVASEYTTDDGHKMDGFQLGARSVGTKGSADTNVHTIDGETTVNQILAWAGTGTDLAEGETGLSDASGHPIFYFYLGDIIYAAFQIVLESHEERGGQEAYAALLDSISVVLGPLNLVEPETGKKLQINLADIPISYTYFLQWWMQNVIKRKLKSYALVDFIREVIKGMVVDVLEDSQTSCFASMPGLKVRVNNISATGAQVSVDESKLAGNSWDSNTSQNAIQGWIMKQYNEIKLATYLPKNRLYLDLLGAESKFKKQLPILKTENARSGYIPSSKTTTFFVFYAEGMVSSDLKGKFVDDQKKGIPHFRIGSDKGIVKSIKFSRIDAKYMREGRWAATDKSGADTQFRQFKDIYNADVELFGNARLFPGQMVYIDPSGMSPQMGSPADEKSMAFLMGIGGYYMITKVESSIAAGTFSTTLHCTFTQNGSPIARLDTAGDDPFVETCARAAEFITTPGAGQGAAAVASSISEAAPSHVRFNEDYYDSEPIPGWNRERMANMFGHSVEE